MKQHLLLCYLQYLCYYILLKLKGHSISNHPVVERLVELKLLVTKLKPIESKLQTQISELLQSSGNPSNRLKPRPDLLVPFGAEEETLPAGSNSEHLSDSDDGEVKASAVYKAPKLVSVEYTERLKVRVDV